MSVIAGRQRDRSLFSWTLFSRVERKDNKWVSTLIYNIEMISVRKVLGERLSDLGRYLDKKISIIHNELNISVK